MNAPVELDELEIGYDMPACRGMDEADIETPCLILDLDAPERNIRKIGRFVQETGVRHRLHGKMHASIDIAKLQEELGGARGVCCQKVSEAEVFARSGIKDVLVSNEVCDPAEIHRLAGLPKLGARTIVCVDDIVNVADLSEAAQRHGAEIECLVKIDWDAGLKAQPVDSGLPVIFGCDDVEYVKSSDEHGVIADPKEKLKVSDKLKLVPGHCGPTYNMHDFYVGVRNGKVEMVWSVSARGKAY